jgi:hypothetical protein
MYDILRAMGKDAGFLYETIDTYIKDAQSANKNELVETWQTIKKDRLRHFAYVKRGVREGNTRIIVQTQTCLFLSIVYKVGRVETILH